MYGRNQGSCTKRSRLKKSSAKNFVIKICHLARMTQEILPARLTRRKFKNGNWKI